LFRRVARGMVLTPEGTRLLPFAETILQDLEKLESAAGLPAGTSSELRLGAGDALARRLLPRALARLLEEMPGIDVRLREGTGANLLAALRDGEIDQGVHRSTSRKVVHRSSSNIHRGYRTLDVDLTVFSKSGADPQAGLVPALGDLPDRPGRSRPLPLAPQASPP